ncbi:molecular chaperone DnaK [Lujinxingia sediminis]|uniref:Molecular chaperone DnaK n=1 Tax=Lujinxingia sediminis TaxID=2480984 RepID=A0ABY0CWZ4_9DELT|nr:molecular chaperone DnaK [Lujinxingia sediminis]RVU48234.1 molecular chaperone DnaK [Lujinxingia sediminis]
MERIIGIDLGTTNSCVAIVEGGTPQVIPNKGGYKTTPSVVAITESGRRLVGQMAKRQAITNARHTVYASKRLIGRKWNSSEVRHCIETCPYEIVQGPHEDVRIKLRDKEYSLPEISSIILQEMKLVAQEFLGEEPTKAVVTVPAYFNDNQRTATRDAGRIAGLDIVRIINEPTAAALAYGFGKNLDATVAIYDLGGGTFDISILDIHEGVFDVLSTAGDTFLGGEDFDARIIEHLAFEFAREHKVDLRKDEMALQRLRDAAEKAKIELSSMPETEISLPFIHSRDDGEALHLQTTLTRDAFEELVIDLVQRTIKICQATLQESGLEIDDIDDVILVGGMTRMPRIQVAVRDYFDKAPSKQVHPDEAVALGASVQGAALIEGSSDVLLLDVTPHSLGIMVHGGGFEVLIEANATIPTSHGHIFTTVRDNQTSVKIIVLQGESPNAEENEMLGEFVLSGLRRAPAGEVEVEVAFEISADGIVSVQARDLETGKEQSITVTATSGLTEEEIQNMIEENEDYLVELKRDEELERARGQIRKSVRELEKLTERTISNGDGHLLEHLRERVTRSVENARQALDSKDTARLTTIADEIQQVLQSVKAAAMGA